MYLFLPGIYSKLIGCINSGSFVSCKIIKEGKAFLHAPALLLGAVPRPPR
jgi:hypothetical protein